MSVLFKGGNWLYQLREKNPEDWGMKIYEDLNHHTYVQTLTHGGSEGEREMSQNKMRPL